MSLGALGAFALVLVVVFLFGQLWFHLVEAISSRIKRLFFHRREPPAWHPLPPEEDQDP